MTSTEWQLARDAAERYQAIIVPAILGPAAQALVDHAGLEPGTTVLDVGCGTGAAARLAAERVGPRGRVVGADLNAAMLAVAREQPSTGAPIEWIEGSALSLDLPSRTFATVLCAQTLQFIPDRAAALSEMHRVLAPGGHLALSVWAPIERSRYFDALTRAIDDQLGSSVAAALRAAFSLSSRDQVLDLLSAAGFVDPEAVERELPLHLGPLSEFIPRQLSATPMAAAFAAAAPETRLALVQQVETQLEGHPLQVQTHLIRGKKP